MTNANAKTDFLTFLECLEYDDFILHTEIKCVTITYRDNHKTKPNKTVLLKVGYTKEDYDFFLRELDFMYDSSFGSQELFGTMWFKDNNCWAEITEYDGAEGWELMLYPNISDDLLTN